MELKSTLEREMERVEVNIKKARDEGLKPSSELMEVFNLIDNSSSFMTARLRTIKVATDIQPSIGPEDLRIASDMQLATASELLVNLIKEGLIKINK